MKITIQNMTKENIADYAGLYVSVFNSPPWNDLWSEKTAMRRISEMMSSETFIGKAAYIDDAPVGIIMGQSEQGDVSVQFHLLEFCVKTTAQNKGIGTSLMNELTAELKSQGITHIYLITSHGEKTEGFYSRRGFRTVSEIVMVNDID